MGGAKRVCRCMQSVGAKRINDRPPFYPWNLSRGKMRRRDWGEAQVILAGVQQKVQVFVMHLCYSRRTFVMTFPAQKQEAFFYGHVRAFEHFGGVPHRLSYDNLSSAVKPLIEGRVREEQRAFVLEQPHDDRHGDVVRQVGHHGPRAKPGEHLMPIRRYGVRDHHPDVLVSIGHLAQRRHQARVHLHRHHLGAGVGQDGGQGTDPRADLQDVAAGGYLGQANDAPGQGRIDQEVLPEGLAGLDVVATRQVPDAGGREAGEAPATR